MLNLKKGCDYMIEEIKEYIKEIEENIEYGWYDTKNNLREHIDKDFMIEYRTRTPEEIKKSKHGICWDLVELEREYLEEKKADFKTIFVVINDIILKHPNHSFIIIKENDKYYWLEATLKDHKGIHEFNTLEELKNKIIEVFPIIANRPIDEKDSKRIEFFEFERPKNAIKAIDYFIYVTKGNKI